MGYIQCCGGLRECKSFELFPDDEFKIKEMLYLEECPVCGHTVLQLIKVDLQNNISKYRITNKKARKFFEKYSKDISKEIIEQVNFVKPQGKFYLNYNEYGRKRKCYSNLSSMKLGLFEDNF